MRQVWITRTGGPEVLETRTTSDPRPGPGQACVEVHAAGVNFADIMARMGLYAEAPRAPFVPGYEISGTVVEAAPGVPLPTGARVMGITRFGGYSTHVVVPHRQLWVMPEDMSFEQGAALPVAYLTASLALRRFGRLERGEWVLIRSAAGGVGLAAVQLALAVGAHVVGVAGPTKHERLRRAGVELTLDPRDDPREAVRDATSGRGLDVVVNSSGGRTVRQDLRLLAPLGRLVLCGISTAAPGTRRSLPRLLRLVASTPRPTLFGLMNRSQGIFGLNLGRLWSETERLREEIAHVLDLYGRGLVRPVIDRVFPLEQAPTAHRYIQERLNYGKVLLGTLQDPEVRPS